MRIKKSFIKRLIREEIEAVFDSRIKRAPRPGKGEKHLPRRKRVTRRVPGGTRSKSGLSTATNAIHKTIIKKLKNIPTSELANSVNQLSGNRTIDMRIPIADVMQTKKGTSRNLQSVFAKLPDLKDIEIVIKKGDSRHPLQLVAGRAEPPVIRLTIEINPKKWADMPPGKLWAAVDNNLRNKTHLRGIHMNTITHEMVHFLQPNSPELRKHIMSLEDMTPEEAAKRARWIEYDKARKPRRGYTAYEDPRKGGHKAPKGSSEFGYKLDSTKAPASAGKVSFGMAGWSPLHYTRPTEIQANFIAVHETSRKQGVEFIQLWKEFIDDSNMRMQKDLGLTDKQWKYYKKDIEKHIMKESEKIAKKMFPQYLNDIRIELQKTYGPRKNIDSRRYLRRSTGKLPKQPPHQKPQKKAKLRQLRQRIRNNPKLQKQLQKEMAKLQAANIPQKPGALRKVLSKLPIVGRLFILAGIGYGADQAYAAGGGKGVAKYAGETAIDLTPVVGDIKGLVELVMLLAGQRSGGSPLTPDDPRWFSPMHKL